MNLLGLLVVGGGHHHHGRISESNREDDDDDTELNGSKYKHLNGGHSHGNGNMKAVFLHLLGDALGSVIVAVTALIVMYVPVSLFSVFFPPFLCFFLFILFVFCLSP